MEMGMVTLSKRLQSLVDMVTPGNRVVDVGCDHGFVSIGLVQQEISPRVLAMDVRTGPLSRAEEHIAEYGLGDYIETRLSDGLNAYEVGEADTMICAGMGGKLMMRILQEGDAKVRAMRELILQPQSDLPAFRRFLAQEGYQILDENILWEEDKYYFLFRVSPTGGDREPLSETDAKYGKILLQKKDAVLQSYLQDSLKTVEQIIESLQGNETDRATERLQEVRKEKCDLHQALETVNG